MASCFWNRWLVYARAGIVGLVLSWPLVCADAGKDAEAQARELETARCLASVVWHEARGETPRARRATLDVVWNRALKSGKSICEVVAQPKQFSWYDKKNLLPMPLTEAHVVNYIEAIEQPQALSQHELWFYSSSSSGNKPEWAKRMACKRIGKLNFCKERK